MLKTQGKICPLNTLKDYILPRIPYKLWFIYASKYMLDHSKSKTLKGTNGKNYYLGALMVI